jgi:hypothetical protein
MASYIRRRKFLATLLGGAAAWPLAARAQTSKTLRIGIVSINPRTSPVWVTFLQRLQELGTQRGSNSANGCEQDTTPPSSRRRRQVRRQRDLAGPAEIGSGS